MSNTATIPDELRQQALAAVRATDPADAGQGHVVAGLTSAQAETKLAAIAALPPIETTE